MTPEQQELADACQWEDGAASLAELEKYDVLGWNEDTGYGYDGAIYALLRHRETGELHEYEDAHCSCYGYSAFAPAPITREYLQQRLTAPKSRFPEDQEWRPVIEQYLAEA